MGEIPRTINMSMREYMMIVESYVKHPETDVPPNMPEDSHFQRYDLDFKPVGSLIGPHGRREIGLMKRGLKPAALVQDFEIELWKKPAEENGWIIRKIKSFDPKHDQFVVCLPGHEARANQLEKIYANVQTKGLSIIDHMRIGRLLGYNKNQVNAFIKKITA